MWKVAILDDGDNNNYNNSNNNSYFVIIIIIIYHNYCHHHYEKAEQIILEIAIGLSPGSLITARVKQGTTQRNGVKHIF